MTEAERQELIQRNREEGARNRLTHRETKRVHRTPEEAATIGRLVRWATQTPEIVLHLEDAAETGSGELTADELAELLGCSVPTVRKKIKPLIADGSVLCTRAYSPSTRLPALYAIPPKPADGGLWRPGHP